MPSIDHIAKNIFAIPLHLFVRGPQYPELWLGKMPVFDVFCLVLSLAGAYFYARHRSNSRSKLLALLAAISILLVGFGGPVKLSLFVPIVYLCAATGVTYLLQEWLKVFPINPLARALGIALITTAVGLSCTLNTRAYFVAWPHNLQTKAVFQNHL